MAVIDVSGISFFMPVFGFLLVTLVVYAVLAATKILGDHNFFNFFIALIMGVIFLSFSSLQLYVQTVVPWFVVLLFVVFLILLIGGFVGGKPDWIMNKGVGWVVVIILIIVFLIAAIRVFNPVFHPDLVITGGENGPSMLSQLTDFFGTSRVIGSVLLLIIAAIVAWVVTKFG